jgi:Do/DeqQ family serine protease
MKTSNNYSFVQLALTGLVSGSLVLGAQSLLTTTHTQIIVKEDTKASNSTGAQKVHYLEDPTLYSPPSGTPVDFTSAAERTLNTVVHIKTTYITNYRLSPIQEYFYGPGIRQKSSESSGSGVIISSDGYIITNNHVIADADHIEVTLDDGQSYAATIVGTDPSTDIAVVRIKANDLPHATFGNSDLVKVGEWVLAVGNPFNLNSTVTAGIVSAKARSINLFKGNYSQEIMPIESFIQTDAAVNPGNSGGALVTADGLLIGINTAIASKTGSYTGYSFAVPSNIAQKVAHDLIEYGVVQRAFIGVNLADINQKILEEKNLPNLKGVLVVSVLPNSSAKDAGLKENDVILKVGSIEVNKVPELQEQLSKFRPGDEVLLTIRRNQKTETLKLTLKNHEGTTDLVKKEDLSKKSALGATFHTLSAQELKPYQLKNGVQISQLQSGKLKSAGMSQGFIIVRIDQQPVYTAEEVAEILQNKSGGVYIEGYYPNGMQGYFGFGL